MKETGLGADSEVVLLLCGRFGGERKEPYAPLSAAEYGALARWLKERELRPSDMLTADGQAQFGDLVQARLERTRIEFLLGRGTGLALSVERWQRGGLWVISRADSAYPQRYRQHFRHVSPPLLFGAGDVTLLARGGLAIVGSRKAGEDAAVFTSRVGTRCADEGLAVVSGGARGIDSVAMQAAIDGGGTAVGVLACDLLKSSMSRSNRSAIQAGRLVLMSPFSPEAGFNAGNAMARNRLIYALANCALVVDSTQDSGGTWAGATENLRHGWVPLYVRVPDEGGGNVALAANGAKEFNFDLSSKDSLLRYLELGCAQGAQDGKTTSSSQVGSVEKTHVAPDLNEPKPASYSGAIVGTEAGGAQLDLEAPVSAQRTARTDEPPAEKTPELATEGLDMYPVFLSRIEALLKGRMSTEDEIAQALGLDAKQAKIWLRQAIEQGRLTRKMAPSQGDGKKKAHFELNPQAALV